MAGSGSYNRTYKKLPNNSKKIVSVFQSLHQHRLQDQSGKRVLVVLHGKHLSPDVSFLIDKIEYCTGAGTGYNNHTHKKLPNIGKKSVSALLSLHRLRHRPKSAGYIRLRRLIWNYALLKVQLALDCGSGSDYSDFFNRNNCIVNRNSLNFLNLQVQDFDCGAGPDYIVIFIGRLYYSLHGSFIVCRHNSICLGNRDILKFHIRLRHLIWNFALLKVQLAMDCGSGSDYSDFFNRNNCIGNRNSRKFLNLQVQDFDC